MRKPKKILLILLAIVLAVVALAAFLLINKEENRDYTDPETYIGLSESKAVERAEETDLEYSIVDYDKRSEIGIIGTTELVLYVSDGKVVSVYLQPIPGKP